MWDFSKTWVMVMRDESEAVLRELKEIERERFYRNWWRFQYVHRYFVAEVLRDKDVKKDVEKTLRRLPELYRELSVGRGTLNRQDSGYMNTLFQFANCLVYDFHKQFYADGFQDPFYETLLENYQNPLKRIKSHEDLEMIQFLHDWTVEFGFLIVPLLGRPDTSASWEAFITGSPKKVFGRIAPCLYTYPKFEEVIRGIKVSTSFNQFERPKDCDLAIYWQTQKKTVRENQDEIKKQLALIKKDLKSCWNCEGIQTVGKQNGYEVALYVHRKKCSVNHVMEKLEGQIQWQETFPLPYCIWSPDSPGQIDSKAKSNLELLRAIKLTEGLTKKKMDLESDNVRRAVGLYLWDSFNMKCVDKKRHRFILETIKFLHGNHKSKLSIYYKNYNKKYKKPTKPAPPKKELSKNATDKEIKQKNEREREFYSGETVYKARLLGDEDLAKADVKKDMDDDYKLTEFCIEQADYFSLEERRKSRKANKSKKGSNTSKASKSPRTIKMKY